MNGIRNTYLYVCGSQRLLNIRRIYTSAGLIGLTSEDTSAMYLAGCGDVYDLFRCDRTSRAGGGVAVYCKRCLNPVRIAVPDTFSYLEAV